MLFLLSVSCPVAVILSHCGASVTKTNSSYVSTYLAIKLILILILILKKAETSYGVTENVLHCDTCTVTPQDEDVTPEDKVSLKSILNN